LNVLSPTRETHPQKNSCGGLRYDALPRERLGREGVLVAARDLARERADHDVDRAAADHRDADLPIRIATV
jgi:hypothetical protein